MREPLWPKEWIFQQVMCPSRGGGGVKVNALICTRCLSLGGKPQPVRLVRDEKEGHVWAACTCGTKFHAFSCVPHIETPPEPEPRKRAEKPGESEARKPAPPPTPSESVTESEAVKSKEPEKPVSEIPPVTPAGEPTSAPVSVPGP